MFLSGKKNVKLIEYTCASARPKHKHLKQDTTSRYNEQIEFSPLRLSIALARTILSNNPKSHDMFLQTFSSFFNVQSLIGGSSQNLRLTGDMRGKFRDFSASGRTGELAQALTYLFAQDVLGYPIVVDLEGYLEENNYLSRYPYVGEKPDFIASKINSNIITIVESKGSCPENDKEKLKGVIRGGLEQCDNAVRYFNTNAIPLTVQNSYTCGIWFSTSTGTWDTTLHFADPEYNSDKKISDPLPLARYHYSSWFAMLGYYEQVEELLLNKSFSLQEPKESLVFSNEKFYIIHPRPKSALLRMLELINLTDVIECGWIPLKFGISEKIFGLLRGYQDSNKYDFNFKPIVNDKIEMFTDGTIVLYNSKPEETERVYHTRKYKFR